jgi:hypothetical protein
MRLEKSQTFDYPEKHRPRINDAGIALEKS